MHDSHCDHQYCLNLNCCWSVVADVKSIEFPLLTNASNQRTMTFKFDPFLKKVEIKVALTSSLEVDATSDETDGNERLVGKMLLRTHFSLKW